MAGSEVTPRRDDEGLHHEVRASEVRVRLVVVAVGGLDPALGDGPRAAVVGLEDRRVDARHLPELDGDGNELTPAPCPCRHREEGEGGGDVLLSLGEGAGRSSVEHCVIGQVQAALGAGRSDRVVFAHDRLEHGVRDRESRLRT